MPDLPTMSIHVPASLATSETSVSSLLQQYCLATPVLMIFRKMLRRMLRKQHYTATLDRGSLMGAACMPKAP